MLITVALHTHYIHKNNKTSVVIFTLTEKLQPLIINADYSR